MDDKIYIVVVPLRLTDFTSYAYKTLQSPEDQDTLVLLHVLFRHGNRTADGPHELYPNDPYVNETYFPYGLGQLTNTGKRKMFGIGKALRMRYNDFLGKYYYPNEVEAFSTDYNRTKMSLQLVLAGLFPPTESQIWEKELLWQPVPFNYLPKYQDKVLLGVLCPRYLEMYEAVSSSPEMQKQFNEQKDIFRYISNHTGLNITRFLNVYNLYFGISTQEEWGFKLPMWTKKVWPEIITQLAIRDYFVSMTTIEMKKMAIGYLLQKIIEDTKKKILSSNQEGRKMYLYSGHENNIAELLMILGVFKPHIPNYGAYIALEIHQIDRVFGVKIVYQNHSQDGIKILKMPGCEEFCPLEQFIEYTQEFIPSDDLCGI